MNTLYAACLSRLGLSRAEAAALHNVRIDTVNSWASGRRMVPDGAWDDLRAREARIIDGSEELLEAWRAAGSPPIGIDDEKASGSSRIVVADFILNSTGPVRIGKTAATQIARQARRPN